MLTLNVFELDLIFWMRYFCSNSWYDDLLKTRSRREPYAQLSFFSFSIQGFQFPFVLMFFGMYAFIFQSISIHRQIQDFMILCESSIISNLFDVVHNRLMGNPIWNDLLGLASAHIYYFLKEVCPQEYGREVIKTPQFMTNFFYSIATSGTSSASANLYAGAAENAPPPPPGAGPTPFTGAGHRLGGN